MEVISKNNDIYILDEKEFVPKNIFENGQAFRWDKVNNGYNIVAGKYFAHVRKLNESEVKSFGNYKDVVIIENGGTLDDYESFWRNYFDMDRDYFKLRKSFMEMDDNLRKACEFGVGLRVLKQDLLEMIISFIISANNQIPRIKSSIEKICELVGDKIYSRDGKDYYAFPSLEQLSNLTEEVLTDYARVGYRAKYLVNTIKMLKDNEVSLDKVRLLPYEEAHKELCKLQGVGPKVADCILLFGDSRDEAFPVDTWVIKFMNEYYVDNVKSMKKIKKAGAKIFKDKAGLAQQYLFFYARENKVGVKKRG